MENQSLLLTLGGGTLVSFLLFFIFYKVLKQSGKLAALLTILLVQIVYIPLAAMNWAGLDVFAIHFAFFTMAAAGLGIIVNQRQPRNAMQSTASDSKKFHWAPAIIIGFFMILAAVDSTIITLANKGASAEFMQRFLPEPQRQSATNVISAFPGTVANDYHKKYSLYNNYVSQLRVQRERGWQVKDGWVEKPHAHKPTPFKLTVLDKAGSPIVGAKVVVSFLRPSDKSQDTVFTLPEQGSGVYAQPLLLPAPGLWMMLITITKGEDVHEIKGETWLEPATP